MAQRQQRRPLPFLDEFAVAGGDNVGLSVRLARMNRYPAPSSSYSTAAFWYRSTRVSVVSLRADLGPIRRPSSALGALVSPRRSQR